jgi:hypothetical protein
MKPNWSKLWTEPYKVGYTTDGFEKDIETYYFKNKKATD